MIRANMSKKVELANDEMIVRLARLTNIRVTAIMAIRLTQGTLLCRRLKPNAGGRALSVAMIIPRRAVPNMVALIADAVDNRAATPISKNPA